MMPIKMVDYYDVLYNSFKLSLILKTMDQVCVRSPIEDISVRLRARLFPHFIANRHLLIWVVFQHPTSI
jgi:hypothetical protein